MTLRFILSKKNFLKTLWNNTTYRFLILFLGIFAFLYYFNVAYNGIIAPGNIYIEFIDEHLNYVEGLRFVLLESSALILKGLNFQVFTTDIWLRVAGRGGIIVAYDCLGFGVMSFFTAFVLAYPKSLKSKMWFLPAGLLFIQLLNIARFVLLALYWRSSDLKDSIDHHDLFNIILYIILLVVIYLWVNKKELVVGWGEE